MLSKSDFLRYIRCSRYSWLFKHNPNLRSKIEISVAQQRTIDEGYQIEGLARELYPKGQLIEKKTAEAAEQTKEAIDKGAKVLYQATVLIDDLLAMADIFYFDEKKDYWVIGEVKGTTKVEEDHIYDATFQKVAFEKAGYSIGRVELLHVNSDYIREGEIDIQHLLKVEDITEEVKHKESEVQLLIKDALKNQGKQDEPLPAILKQCKRGQMEACPFIGHCWKHIPKYSIYDVSRISEPKLQILLEEGVLSVEDIPKELPLSDKQRLQVDVAKSGEPFIDLEGIDEMVKDLELPLYFLDYESVNPAVPLFDGYRPYQQMVFQYSLHVLDYPEAELRHVEYVHRELSDPAPELLAHMSEHIGESGSVIVWHKSFEMGRNTELAEMHPEYIPFMNSINSRVFDLKEVFSKGHYVHPEFKGSSSIKKVLPVLVPEMSYKGFDISEGATASVMWLKAVTDQINNKEKVFEDLITYCELDTVAMVRVWEHLYDLLLQLPFPREK